MAAGAGDIKAGRAYISIYADKDPLVKGLKSMASEFSAIGHDIGAVGTKILGVGLALKGVFAAAVGDFVQMGSELRGASARTGIAVEDLSKLKYAAERSGGGLEELVAAFKFLSKSQFEAKSGNQDMIATFEALGLSLADLQKLSPEEKLKRIADGLRNIPSDDRAAVAIKVLGRSALDMVPLLLKGSAGIQELEDHLVEIGGVISTKSANAAGALKREMADLWTVIKHVGFEVGSVLAPALQSLFHDLTRAAVGTLGWVKENSQLVIELSRAATAIIVVGAAIKGLSIAFAIGGAALGAFAKVVSIVSALGTALSGTFTAFGATITLGSIAGPIAAFAALATLLTVGGVLLYRYIKGTTEAEGALSKEADAGKRLAAALDEASSARAKFAGATSRGDLDEQTKAIDDQVEAMKKAKAALVDASTKHQFTPNQEAFLQDYRDRGFSETGQRIQELKREFEKDAKTALVTMLPLEKKLEILQGLQLDPIKTAPGSGGAVKITDTIIAIDSAMDKLIEKRKNLKQSQIDLDLSGTRSQLDEELALIKARGIKDQFDREEEIARLHYEKMRKMAGGDALDRLALLQEGINKSKHLLEAGNLDLRNRPLVKNADGSTSTVRSISVGIGEPGDDKTVLLATVTETGEILSNIQAIDKFRIDGKHLGIFDSAKAADEFAVTLHNAQAEFYGLEKSASANAATITAIQRNLNAALARIDQERADEEAKRNKQLDDEDEKEFNARAASRLKAEQDINDEIAKLDIQTRTPRGRQQDQALLELERQIALRKNLENFNGIDPALIKQQFDLQKQLLEMRNIEPPRGTFNAAAIQSLQAGPSSVAERTAKATEKTATNTTRLLQEGGLSFA